MTGTVEFFGESFRFNPGEDYQMEMLEFADAATSGADSELLAGMAAVVRLLKAAIVTEDWDRFWALARKNKAQVKRDLMPVVVAAFTQETGRPTGRPSDSSDGPTTTPPSSEVDSYSRVIAREEAAGRPDRALMVLLAQEAQASSAS